MAYTDRDAVRVALTQVDKHKAEAARLKTAIKEHYRRVHAGDWGADDVLWATVGLEANVEVVG